MSWPVDRFNAIYKALVQRQAVESIERQRGQMIAALFSNPNWDQKDSKREDQIRDLNNHFNRAIELLYYPKDKEPDIDWNNPFYAAARRGLEKTRQKYGIDGAKTMDDVVKVEMDADQLEARERSRNEIDQI